MKVDFMIIGAAKCGTTSLANGLSDHPEVCFSEEKEPEFFSAHTDWAKKLNGYHALYKPYNGQKLGEGSTNYTMHPEFPNTHKRLHEYNPNLKLIYIMRDPIKRMESHFAHNYVRGRIEKPMEEEVLGNPSFITRSSYHMQISPYIEQFGRENVLLIVFEEYVRNPKEAFIQMATFIGLDTNYYEQKEDYSQKNQTANRKILVDGGKGKIFKPLKKIRRFIPESIVNAGLRLFGSSIEKNPEFPETLKAELYRKIKGEVEKTEKLLGKKLSVWKKY